MQGQSIVHKARSCCQAAFAKILFGINLELLRICELFWVQYFFLFSLAALWVFVSHIELLQVMCQRKHRDFYEISDSSCVLVSGLKSLVSNLGTSGLHCCNETATKQLPWWKIHAESSPVIGQRRTWFIGQNECLSFGSHFMWMISYHCWFANFHSKLFSENYSLYSLEDKHSINDWEHR